MSYSTSISIWQKAFLLSIGLMVPLVAVYAQEQQTVEWKDGRARLRSEDTGRLKVGPPPGYYDNSTTNEANSSENASKKEESKSESTADVSTIYSSAMMSAEPLQVISVTGSSLPIYGGGLPRMYAPGIRWMGMDVAMGLGTSSSYNDNIFLRSGKNGQKREGDFIQTVSPSFSLTTSNHEDGKTLAPNTSSISLQASPSALFFADHTDQNTVNNDATLTLNKRFSKTSIYLAQSYSSVAGGNLESGDLAQNEWYTTNAILQYEMSPKIVLEGTDKLVVRSYEHGYGSKDNLVSAWVNYLYSEKIQIGIAPSYGFIDAENGSDQTYQQGSTRIIYTPSEKTSLYAQVGIDRREYRHSSLENYNIVFNGGGKWQFSPKSDFSYEISRRIQTSNAYQNQDVTLTGFETKIRHGVIKDVVAYLSNSYNNAQYDGTSGTETAEREDNSFTLSPGIQWSVLEWWDLNLSYSYRRSFSGKAINEYENNIFTVGSILRF